jgi:hypothetical protein
MEVAMVRTRSGFEGRRRPLSFPYKSRLVTRRGKAWWVDRHCFPSKEEAFEYIDWHY